MGELIEGFEKSIDDEYARLRTELRAAIAESGYTLEQIAALAGVSRRTLHNLLNGVGGVGTDNFLRVAFVVGCRVEIAAPEGKAERPFQVVPLAAGSRRSSVASPASASSARGERDSHTTEAKKVRKGNSDQRQKTPRRKGVTGWSPRSVIDLRGWRDSRPGEPEVTAPRSKAA